MERVTNNKELLKKHMETYYCKSFHIGINIKKCILAKTIRNNNRTSEGIIITDLKLYYRVLMIKTIWYWYRDRQEVQWYRTEDREMNPYTYGHLIFNKRAKTI